MKSRFSEITVVLLALYLFLFAGTVSAEDSRPAEQNKNLLTSTEIAWIAANPVVAFTGDPNWLPYEAFQPDGTYIGMVADHLAVIERETGLKFSTVPVTSWSESLRIATQGHVDVISGDAADSILNRRFKPVDTYSQNPIVIIMAHRQNHVETLSSINTKRIAIIKDYGYTADVYKTYPDIEFIEVENIQEGLEGVSRNQFDALLATHALSSYHIAEMGIHNVKIVGKTPIIMDLTLFVARDKPQLFAIINKTLKSMSPEESQDILNKWVRSRYVEKPDYTLTIAIAAGMLSLLLAALYWNRRLAKSERKLNRFHRQLNQSPDSIFVIRAEDGRILEANQSACRSLGYGSREMLLLHVWEFSERIETVEQWKSLLPKLIEFRGRNFESIHRRSDGSRFPVEINAQHIEEPGENLFIAIARDITDRKAAETALNESNNKYRALTESTKDFIWEVDADGVYTYCSPQTLQIFGYRPEEMVGKRPFDLMPAEEAKRIQALFAKAVANLAPISNLVNANVTADGKEVILETSGQPFLDEQGTLLGYRGVDRDITERIRTENALKKSESRFRELFDNMSDGVAIYAPVDDGENFVFVDYNRAGERIGKNHREDVVGRRVTDVFPGVEDIGLLKILRRVLKTGAPERFPLASYKDSRISLWVENYVFRIRDKEIVAIYQDITERKQAEDALKNSEARFRRLFEQTDAISVQGYNKDREVIYWNPASERLYGYSSEEAMGKHLEDLIIPDAMREEVVSLTTAWSQGGPGIPSSELTLRRADGSPVNVFSSHVMLRGKHDKPEMYCIDIDLSEQKKANDQLRLSASVFSHAMEGILITASDGVIIDANLAFEKMSGYTKAELVGNTPNLLKSGKHPKEFYDQLWDSLLNEGYWSGEVWNRRKNGELYAELLTISSVFDESGSWVEHYVALCSDVTEQKQHQQKLEHIAHYDALTNLPNRVLLADRLQQAMVQEQRRNNLLAVAYLDLDGFKEVNDAHGHDLGDQLLAQLAKRMQEVLRTGDTIARIGGDEFVAVLIDLPEKGDLIELLERLLSTVAKPVQLGDLTVQVSASMGVTFYPQPEPIDADQLLRQADQAMYKAKQAGKNRFQVFDAQQDRDLRGHHETLEAVRKAFARKEFALHYQPKVNLRSGKVVGMEALIRWQHPEKGILPPAEFLPVIEDTPISIEIDEWAIKQAISQVAIWQAEGLSLSVSVNVGALYLQQQNILERLERLLSKYPTAYVELIEFEVLETSALQDISHVSRVMEQCRSMGVRFALDDFGTGYSSLEYLKRLPADTLKIDRSFIRDMLEDPDDFTILDGILGLAASFGREAVAEGVESVMHGEFLLSLGCEIAQGYGIARPMPATQVAEWIENWKPDPRWTNRKPLARDDRPLLYAIVDHRSWTTNVKKSVQGDKVLPASGLHDYRFSNWLEGPGQVRYGSHPSYQKILELHARIHQLVSEFDKLSSQNKAADKELMTRQLDRMTDQLVNQLEKLIPLSS